MSNFIFLTESEEKCLSYLLNRKNNIGFGHDDDIQFKDIDEKMAGFNRVHFNSLNDKGYIEANIWDYMISYHLTAKGVDYFTEKNKHEKKERQNKWNETKRFWISTLISIFALVISFFTFFNSVFHWW